MLHLRGEIRQEVKHTRVEFLFFENHMCFQMYLLTYFISLHKHNSFVAICVVIVNDI